MGFGGVLPNNNGESNGQIWKVNALGPSKGAVGIGRYRLGLGNRVWCFQGLHFLVSISGSLYLRKLPTTKQLF